MAAFTVTTAADVVNAGDGVLSLREAVQRANATTAPDTIAFAGALEGGTLTLTQGQLALTADTAIDGDRNGDGTEVTISGGDASRVLAVSGPSTDVVLADLTIADGNTYALSGRSTGGAGIRANEGVGLTLQGCTLQDNGFRTDGGALVAAAGSEVAVERCMIVGNSGLNGGAIFFEGARLSITASYVGRNGASNGTSSGNFTDGGGIAVTAGFVSITGSTIAANVCGNQGGGLFAAGGSVSLVDSTVAGNATISLYSGGGGIYASSDLALTNATVTGNYADNATSGAAVGAGVRSTGVLSIANSIVAGNFSAFDGDVTSRIRDDVVGGIAASNGHNIFGSAVVGEVAGDRENVAAAGLFAALDPATGGGALALNGGPTPTVALRDAAGNPALGGAEPVAAGDSDQRGFARPAPVGSNPDVGSFELAQTVISRSATAGNDVLTGTAAANTLNGLAGADLLRGLDGNDTLNGGIGGDALRGGFGADRLDGGTGQDTTSYRDATGAVSASLAAGRASGALGADTLIDVENLEGGAAGDRLTGSGLANALGGRGGADRLFGLAGDDRLFGGPGDDLLDGGPGNDALLGALGNDRLYAALGRDLLTGGADADVFDYDRLADSVVGASRDVLTDFVHLTDHIDLATIDARAATAGVNDAFVFRAAEGAMFTGAGQVRWFHAAGATIVEASVDADRTAELQIELAGLKALSAADFVL